MTVQVTLAVPDAVHLQVEQLAKTTQRPINELMAEAVTRSFSSFYIDDRREQMEQEVAAFEAMHKQLWEKYANQYVAIYRGQVIDADADQIALLGRLDIAYPDAVVLVRQVLPKIQGDLYVRSPRFVSEHV